MKILSSLTGGLLALALASAAHAQTTMRITGSTAFRSNAINAVINIYDAGTVTYAYIDNAGGTATVNSATWAIFKGNVGGVSTTVKAHWTGSEGGMQTVAGAPTFTVS